MTQDQYEAEKARLKKVRQEAGERLQAARKCRLSGPEWHEVLNDYVAAQDALKAFYRQHLGPVPTRAERRCASLRAKGITPAW